MAYCRFSEGDVYLFATGDRWICQHCKLAPLRRTCSLPSPLDAIQHLLEHRKAGHAVPGRAIDRLEDEVAPWLQDHAEKGYILHALDLHFRENLSFPGLLETLFEIPRELWEREFYSILENFDPREHFDPKDPFSSWKHITDFTFNLAMCDRFKDRNRVIFILYFWKRGVRSLLEQGLLPHRFPNPPQSQEDTLLAEIFGDMARPPHPEEFLEEIQEEIDRLLSQGPGSPGDIS